MGLGGSIGGKNGRFGALLGSDLGETAEGCHWLVEKQRVSFVSKSATSGLNPQSDMDVNGDGNLEGRGMPTPSPLSLPPTCNIPISMSHHWTSSDIQHLSMQ